MPLPPGYTVSQIGEGDASDSRPPAQTRSGLPSGYVVSGTNGDTADVAKPSSQHGLFDIGWLVPHIDFGALGEGIKEFPEEIQKQAAAHKGQTLAQMVQSPEDEQTAQSIALMTVPVPNASAAAVAPARAPSAAQSLLKDFQATGVTPSVPAVGQGRAAGLAAQAGRMLPFSPVVGGMQKSLEETGSAAESAASGFGQARTAEEAGNVARNAARRFAGDRSEAARDYGQFYQLMQGAAPAPVANTLKLLNELKGRFPNAPELTGLFTNSKLSQLQESLEPRTVNIPAKTSTMLGPSGQPIVVSPAQTVRRGGVLSMPELKELHSQVGYMLENPAFGPEAIPKAQLRRLYGALSQDLAAGAAKQGPRAAQALARATINYGVRMGALDRLEPLLSPEAGERSFARLNAAALDRGSQDAGLLQTAKRIMTPQEWGDVGAATIRRLGEPTPGQKDVLSSGFSLSSYATNWNKLTDRAKDLLFGPDVPGAPRSNLEALSRVVQAQKNVSSLANVSHSGEIVATAAVIEEVTRQLASGQIPWATMAGLGGGYGLSKILMSPRFTSWLYSVPQMTAQSANLQAATQRALTALTLTMMPQPRSPLWEGQQPQASGQGPQGLPQSITDPYAAQMGAPQ